MCKLSLLHLLGHDPRCLCHDGGDGGKGVIIRSIDVVVFPQQPLHNVVDISGCEHSLNVIMPLPGPSGCARGGLTPLFVVTADASSGSVAVAVALSSLLYAAALTRSAPWDRVLSAFVPATGLMLGHTTLDRVVAVPLAVTALWYLSGDTAKATAPVLMATLAGPLAIAAGSSCDGLVPVGSDVVSLLVAVAALLRCDDRRLTAGQLWAAAEFGLVVLVLASDPAELGARETHLTWWNIVNQAVWLFARLGGSDQFVWLTASLLNCVVLVGVWFMSGTKCSMLQEAQQEAGDLGYFFGNFILHYYPSLRLLSAPPTTLRRPYRQVVVALAIVAVYCVSVDPKAVYGCQSWLDRDIVLVSFWGVIGVSALILAQCGSWAIPGLW
ncbi:MAG: hypothetical protein ACPGR8_01150 [Limisphaerales bacterium]